MACSNTDEESNGLDGVVAVVAASDATADSGVTLVDWREWRATVPSREAVLTIEGLRGQKAVSNAQFVDGAT